MHFADEDVEAFFSNPPIPSAIAGAANSGPISSLDRFTRVLMNSGFAPRSNASQSSRPSASIPKTVEAEKQPPAPVEVVKCGFEQVCHLIIQRSLLLLCGVQSSANLMSETTKKEKERVSSVQEMIFMREIEEDLSLCTSKSLETFQIPERKMGGCENDYQRRTSLLVRRLGRNVTKFLAQEVMSKQREVFIETESSNVCDGWSCEPVEILIALKKQEQRAQLRIEALETVCELVSSPWKTKGSKSTSKPSLGADFLSSVHEFILAGCFQLGLSAPLSFNMIGDMSSTSLEAHLQLCHYLDSIQAAPHLMQKKIVGIVHKIMQWIIGNLQGHHASTASQRDEVKLLNLFALSSRFKADDINLLVKSGLLSVLEKLCSEHYYESGLAENPSSVFEKVESFGKVSCAQYVTVASVRLLHMISVSTA